MSFGNPQVVLSVGSNQQPTPQPGQSGSGSTPSTPGQQTNVQSGGVILGPKPKPPVPTVVTGFQAGHGWFSSGAGVFNMNDPSAFLNGNQCVTVTTDGAGGLSYIKHNNIAPTINATNMMWRFWIRLPNPGDIAHLVGVLPYIGSDNIVANYYGGNSIYEGLSSDWYANDYGAPGNGWMGITMSLGEMTTNVTGAPNIAAILATWLRVQDDNTGNPVTVQFGGIEMIPIPTSGTVSFTFDDGRYTQYSQARLKLSQYRFPATAYIIRDLIDNPNPGAPASNLGNGPYYMTTGQLRELQEYHGWDIASHCDEVWAHNMPNGLNDLTAAQVEKQITGIRQWLITNGFRAANHFALPKGKHNQTVYDLMRKYFLSDRTTFSLASGAGWIKHETYPATDNIKLVCFYVYSNTTTGQIQAAVDSAFANKEWLILVFHDLVAAPGAGFADTQYSIANFGTIVDYIFNKGIAVRTVADVIEHGM